MSGRDRDRERDRRSAAAASARTNEYFVPKDGIDREVITADICRYLGNDALVRPGNYDNPQTRQIQQGYFITAYRNLTTAMIADLKADSDRWEAERRQNAASRGATNVEYRASTTHQSRQYYGPTEASSTMSTPGYGAPATGSAQSSVYDSGYASSGYGQPATSNYAAPGPGYVQQDNYYVAGAHLRASQSMDVDSTSARAPNSSREVPRQQQYGATPTYSQRDSSTSYYSPQPGGPSSVSSSQYPANPTDPYYGRGTYEPQDPYDSRYQDSSAYNSQASMTSGTPAVAPSSSRRREPDRDDRDRHRRRH